MNFILRESVLSFAAGRPHATWKQSLVDHKASNAAPMVSSPITRFRSTTRSKILEDDDKSESSSFSHIGCHRPRRKMAMTNFVSTLCLVLLCSAMFLISSTLTAAQKYGLDGTYILNETDSDSVNE